jgi:hypothetical protein
MRITLVDSGQSGPSAPAIHIQDELERRYGNKATFLINSGADVLEDRVNILRPADVVIFLVDHTWTTPNAEGIKAVDRENDPIKLVIETAISLAIPTVTVLLEGSSLPAFDNLPESIQWIVLNPTLEIHDADQIDNVIEQLVLSIDNIVDINAQTTNVDATENRLVPLENEEHAPADKEPVNIAPERHWTQIRDPTEAALAAIQELMQEGKS